MRRLAIKNIKIKCTGKLIDIDKVKIIQGELKSLSKENAEKLKNRIIKYGFDAPLFVWHKGSRYNLLDGTQRLKMIRELIKAGYELKDNKLPCVFIKAVNLADAKKRLLGYISQYGKLNSEGLSEFIQSLDFDEVKLEIDLPNIDLGRFENEFIVEDTAGDDDIPENVKAITRKGDLWELGPHRLLCGDSTDTKQIERLMSGNKADIMVTDPPYSVGYKSRKERPNNVLKSHGRTISDATRDCFIWAQEKDKNCM